MNRRSLLLLTLWLLSPLCLAAQVSTGRITGQVTDTSEAVVPNAQVIVTNVSTNDARTLSSDSAGLYSAPNLVPAEYTVQVTMPGFQSQTKTGLAVSIGQTITLNFVLQPGSQKESVEVVGTAQQLVDTTTSSLSTVITTATVENLPLNSRNFLDLVPLVPGAQPGAQGRNLTENSFSINGGRVTANGFQIDGADIDTPSNDPVRVSPNLEAVGEFQVLTNNFSAEYGRSMGGIIDVKLKSGTNAFHGNLFEYFRNTVLDASQAFSTPPRLPYNFNQFGASAGGPIIKDKLFIFGDYQGERIRQSITAQQNVPLTAEDQPSGGFINGVPQGTYDWSAFCTAKGGSFTGGLCMHTPAGGGPAVVGAGQLFNPYVAGRPPFLNNQIPASFVDRTTALMYSFFPAPNQGCAGEGNTAACPFNFLTDLTAPSNVDSADLHVDYVVSPKDRVSFGMIYSNTENNGGTIFGDQINGNLITQISTVDERLFSLNYTHVFNSNMVNEFNFAYTIDRLDAPVSQGMQFQPLIAGLGGLNTDPNDPFTSGFPLLDIAGAFSTTVLGGPAGGPSKQHHDIPQFSDNFSFIKGRHSFKTGMIARFREYNLQQPLFPRGLYVFNGFTSGNLLGGIVGSQMADGLLGVPIVAEREELTFGAFGERDKEFGAYFQDDFKLNRRLTLNLGLRWDLYKPATEENNHLANFDPATVTMILPGNGVSSSTLNTNWHDFSPHVGFAYSLTADGKTSLRAGYGIAYLQLVNQAVGTITDRLTENPPFNIAIGGAAIIPNAISTPIQTVSQGIPLVVPPDPTIPPAGANVVYIPRNQPTPYSQMWNIDLQRELPGNVLFDIAYVGTAGVHLTGSSNINQGAPGGGASPISPAIGAVEALLNNEQSNYNALQVKVEHRFSAGFFLLGSYTYSRAIDNGSTTTQGDLANGNNSEPQDSFNLQAERGPSDNNADAPVRGELPLRFAVWHRQEIYGQCRPGDEPGCGRVADQRHYGGAERAAFSPLVSTGDSGIAAGPGGAVRPNIVGDPNRAGPVAANPTCVAPTSIHNRDNWYNPCAYLKPVACVRRRGPEQPGRTEFCEFQLFDFQEFLDYREVEAAVPHRNI